MGFNSGFKGLKEKKISKFEETQYDE